MTRASRAAAILAALALAGCGASGHPAAPRTVTFAGTIDVPAITCQAVSLPPAIQPGTQVTITAPDGSVIGAGVLGVPQAAGQFGGLPICALPFRVTGVPHERLYGARVAGTTGTRWTSVPTVSVTYAPLGS